MPFDLQHAVNMNKAENKKIHVRISRIARALCAREECDSVTAPHAEGSVIVPYTGPQTRSMSRGNTTPRNDLRQVPRAGVDIHDNIVIIRE